MKTIVTADLHLAQKFIPEKFELIKQIVAQADRLVINGDLWDAHLCTFDEFLAAWQPLFPLLKSKNTFYIFGNHDRPEFSDQRISQFCTGSGYELDIETGRGIIHIEHGHRLAPSLDDKIKLMQQLYSWRLWRLGNAIFNRIYPDFLNEKQRDRQTERLQAYWREHKTQYYARISSHVHRSNHFVDTNLYITGAIDKTGAHYIEIEGAEIRLKSIKY